MIHADEMLDGSPLCIEHLTAQSTIDDAVALLELPVCDHWVRGFTAS
jgi:hypothetical protein